MVASPAVFAEKMPIYCKNLKAKILKTDSASFAILHLKGCTNSYFLFFSIGFVVFCELNCRPVHPPYFSVICTDCKANYGIPPMTSKLRISKSRKYEKSQSGLGDLVGKQTQFLNQNTS